MTTGEQRNETRRVTGSTRVALRSYAARKRPSCIPAEPLNSASAAAGAGGSACRPATKALEARGGEPAPIWMAVLEATQCQAVADGGDHAVEWDLIAGRAIYTNRSTRTEEIQPLGVQLKGGQSLSVTWMPGETAYTLEVYRQRSHYVA